MVNHSLEGSHCSLKEDDMKGLTNACLVGSLLIAVMAPCTWSQQGPTITRGPAPDTDPTSGVQMYRVHCAVCHGVDGKGNGPAAPALKQPPSDLTQLSKKNGGKFPDFRVANVIEGDSVLPVHGSREMPIWGDVFRSIQRDDPVVKLRVHNLTQYIASLQQK
jgi:mono/diheme cytochrome c family protein